VENDTSWQSQYGGYAPGGPPDQNTWFHRFITGADGRAHCSKCGAVLKDDARDAFLPPRENPRTGSSYWAWIVVASVVVFAIVGVLGWRFVSRTPAPVGSADKPAVIGIGTEPVQTPADEDLVIYKRSDGMTFRALASYSIEAKVIGVRAWADYDKTSSGFPIDLALIWGEAGKSDYEKYVSFRFSTEYSANQWLIYQYRPGASPPWAGAYFQAHVSNNHVCPASRNLYNAVKSLKKGDVVLLQGYLASSVGVNGQRILSSSLTRDDTDAGACEAFYVKRLQVGDQVYK